MVNIYRWIIWQEIKMWHHRNNHRIASCCLSITMFLIVICLKLFKLTKILEFMVIILKMVNLFKVFSLIDGRINTQERFFPCRTDGFCACRFFRDPDSCLSRKSRTFEPRKICWLYRSISPNDQTWWFHCKY